MALFPSALVDLILESSSDPEETLRALRRHDLLDSTVDDAEVLRLIREALAESAVYVPTSPYDDKGPGHFVAFKLADADCLNGLGRAWLNCFRSEVHRLESQARSEKQRPESRARAVVRSPPSAPRPASRESIYPPGAVLIGILLMAVALILRLLGY